MMSNVVFPILGSEVAPLVGREKLIQRIWNDLTKPTPSNLYVVGQRYIGKTVILNALTMCAKREESPYSLVIYWGFGNAPPTSDNEFIEVLCNRLYEAMAVDTEVYGDYREMIVLENTYDTLSDVMHSLDAAEKPVLMIWDGFDKALTQGFLTGQLFGRLRSLFSGACHKVITATRDTPTELARNEKVEDSPFWNVFDPTPVRIGPFDESDHRAALEEAGLIMTQGGMRELVNWAGGQPVVLLSILNELVASGLKECDNNQVNDAVASVRGSLTELLNRIWDDCSTDVKDAFLLLCEREELGRDCVDKHVARFLINHCLATGDGSKLKPTCRLFASHVQGTKPSAGTMGRLFGARESYESEIGSVLELRLKHIERPVNNRLYRAVELSIRDIPHDPDSVLGTLTHIRDQALDVIWIFECGTSRTIPASVITYWTQSPRDSDNIVNDMMHSGDWTIPTDRFRQAAILQRLTGSKMNFESRSKAVSKDVYVLINALHSFRNRAEHPDGQEVHVGMAVSAIMMCIELLDCLSRDFS